MDHRDTMNTVRRSRNRTTWERQSRPGDFPWSVRGRPFPVPEGRRRRLAGGKSAPADAAPGNRADLFRAPAGHRRNGPGGWPICPRRRVVTGMLRDGRRQEILRCPAGAWTVRRGNRGPRPLARACPRLISCGVPPGPRTSCQRQFSGCLVVASATARSSRRARILKSCSTEKTKLRKAGSSSLTAERWERLQPFVFLCVHRVSVVSMP